MIFVVASVVDLTLTGTAIFILRSSYTGFKRSVYIFLGAGTCVNLTGSMSAELTMYWISCRYMQPSLVSSISSFVITE